MIVIRFGSVFLNVVFDGCQQKPYRHHCVIYYTYFPSVWSLVSSRNHERLNECGLRRHCPCVCFPARRNLHATRSQDHMPFILTPLTHTQAVHTIASYPGLPHVQYRALYPDLFSGWTHTQTFHRMASYLQYYGEIMAQSYSTLIV